MRHTGLMVGGVLMGAVGARLHRRAQTEKAKVAVLRQRFVSLLDNAPDLIVTCDGSGTVRYVSPSVTRILGHPPSTLLATRSTDLVHPDDHGVLRAALNHGGSNGSSPRLEVRARHADGSWRHLEFTVNNLLDEPAVCAVVLNGRDVTERRAMEAELRHHVWHDASTGLANRRAFTRAVSDAMTGPDPGDTAVVMICLDRFKALQTTLDPDTAERLIGAMGQRLAVHVGSDDLLASYATSEFAVLCRGVDGHAAARQIARRLLRAAEEPFLLVSGEVRLGASIGVALGRDARGDAAQLIRDAHTAARHATQGGGHRAEVFELAWRDEAASAVRTEGALHSALERGELALHYQPIMDVATGTAIGAEALIRWNHPRLGLVPPSDFIPIAERSNLIRPIGRWVLEEACAQLARWRRDVGRVDLTIAVNLSPRQLEDDDQVDHIWSALSDAGLPGHALTLELTETALLENTTGTIEALGAIRDVGARVAVDDFGTGYSSLRYLQELPVDALKIDRSFVSRLGRTKADDAIVSAIIGLARGCELDIVAEGVEESLHAERLTELGCATAQGFFYGRPQPAEELAGWLGGSTRRR